MRIFMKEIIQLALLICFLCLALQAVAQDKPTQDNPTYEQRNQPVTKNDLLILKQADKILSDEAKWNRKDNRICNPEDITWSLFCSLQKASIEVLGQYDHRGAALQEVRFVVEDMTKGQEFEHRLMDFNNLPTTRFKDIKKVLQIATAHINSRLKKEKMEKLNKDKRTKIAGDFTKNPLSVPFSLPYSTLKNVINVPINTGLLLIE
jgi:hypothetical protein